MGRRTNDSEFTDEYDEEWEDDFEGADARRSRKRPKKDGTSRKRREPSIPWTEEEMEKLLALVEKFYDPDSGIISWAEVAAAMGNRNPKQCREKYQGDLRPHISKAPWSAEEEYVLALAHSQLGNKWSEIAKYLPRRAENTIKNHWYATKRAKADSHTKSFLWLYCTKAGKAPSSVCFGEAKQRWSDLVLNSDGTLQPLAQFEVPEDYFTTGEGARQNERLQEAELIAAQLGPGTVPLRSATARAAALSTGGSAPTVSAGSGRRPRSSQDGGRGSSVPPAGTATVVRTSATVSDARGAPPLPTRRRSSNTHSHSTTTTEALPAHVLWPPMAGVHMTGMPCLAPMHMSLTTGSTALTSARVSTDDSKQVRFSEGGVHSQHSTDMNRARRFSEASNRMSEGGWDGSCMVNVNVHGPAVGVGVDQQAAAQKPPSGQLPQEYHQLEHLTAMAQPRAPVTTGQYCAPVAMYRREAGGVHHMTPAAEEALTALQDMFLGSGAGTVWECFEDCPAEPVNTPGNPPGQLWLPPPHDGVPDAPLGTVFDEPACPPSPDYIQMTRLISNLNGIEEYVAPDLHSNSPLPTAAMLGSARAGVAATAVATGGGAGAGLQLLGVDTNHAEQTAPAGTWSNSVKSVMGQTAGLLPSATGGIHHQQAFAQQLGCGWGPTPVASAQSGMMWGAGLDMSTTGAMAMPHLGAMVPPDLQVGPPLPYDYFASPAGRMPMCMPGHAMLMALPEDNQPKDESSRVQFY